MNYTRDQLIGYWSGAANNNTLLTPKHHPTGLTTVYQGFKSVLTPDLAANLEGFICSGNYSIAQFENRFYPTTPDYIVLKPKDPEFSIPGSGVFGQSGLVLWPCDRLVLVSGGAQGWHIYSELQYNIQMAKKNGSLEFKGVL